MIFGREPALILGAIQAALALSLAFGAKLSTEQVGAIMAASAAVMAVITRQLVTPNARVQSTK